MNQPSGNSAVGGDGRNIGGALIAALAAIAVAIIGLVGTCVTTGYNPLSHFGGKAPTTTFYGYFRDIENGDKTYVGKEELKLTAVKMSDANGEDLAGKSNGKVKNQNGEWIDRAWNMRGFRTGDKILLTYITTAGTVSRSGVVYVVAFGDIHRGHWISTDTFSGKPVMGAYVLASKPLDDATVENELKRAADALKYLDRPQSPLNPDPSTKSN